MKIDDLILCSSTEKTLKNVGCYDVEWFRENWDKISNIPGLGKRGLCDLVTQLAGAIVEPEKFKGPK